MLQITPSLHTLASRTRAAISLALLPALGLSLAGCGGGSMKAPSANTVSSATNVGSAAANSGATTAASTSASSQKNSSSTDHTTTSAAAPTATAAPPSDPQPTTSAASTTATTAASNPAPTAATNPANASATTPPDFDQEAIQDQSGWTWCSATMNGQPCASGLGNATSSMTPSQSDPSRSGKSAKYTIGGNTPYSNAMWWKSLGRVEPMNHLTYDMYFYVSDASSPEALEFDVNQSYGHTRYTWGTECSYQNTGKWDIWNPSTETWVTTDVPCPLVSSNSWHHLTWQFEKVNGQVHYISVAVDGVIMPVDKYFGPQTNYSNGDDIDIAFQMDGDYRQEPYTVWLDQVSLKGWQ